MTPLPDLPNIDAKHWQDIDVDQLVGAGGAREPLRILVLHGSLRSRSYSRFVAEEAGRLLSAMGAEVRHFSAHGLPLPDAEDESHHKVQELRDLAIWAEGMVWVSPERHGNLTAVMKAQIDWLPLSMGGIRPTQGKTLALMQVSGGSQSFNAVNQMRVLGRWMRMLTIPNQSSVPKAFNEFDEAGRMRLSPLYLRIVDVCEELMKFTWMNRERVGYLTSRYSERVESAEEVSRRVNQRSI